jgi:small subunit ribosomal protein S20
VALAHFAHTAVHIAEFGFLQYSGATMPIIKSAKKALRSSKRKRIYNARRKNALQDETKGVKKLIAAGKKDEAIKMLPSVYQAIDKAAKRGVIKKNAASRKKSRIAKALAK